MKKILTSILLSIGLLAPALALANSASITTTASAPVSNRVNTAITRGDSEVYNRLSRLNDLTTRIESLKLLNQSEKDSFSSSLQNIINQLTALKADIDSTSSPATLKADIQSITKSFRVYLLVVPQTDIIVEADRVNTIVGLMQTLATKFSTRITADGSPSNLVSLLADYNTKINDASVKAAAAVSEVVSLTPDNGNTTILASNSSALKDARTKIEAARQDILAARKDAGDIAAALKISATATTTAQ